VRDCALTLAFGIPLAAVGAFFLGLWRQTHPWRPSPWIGWLYDRAERKIANRPGLSPADRAERIAKLQEERNTPPEPEREFGAQFRHDFIHAAASLTLAALLKLVANSFNF
jgi:hypothetical protein